MSKLSRRTLVAGTATLPALTIPAVAATTVASASACTLPPELVERFIRVRAWYLEYSERWQQSSDEIKRRFQAATGLTTDQRREIDYADPRRKELDKVWNEIYKAVEDGEDSDAECDELSHERWGVAEAMLAQRPQTTTDLAYMAEAYLIADLEILAGDANDRLLPLLFQRIRALGALPQLDDPTGVLSINLDSDEGEEV